MFDEFRSNLLLLLHCKHPEGMMLDRLESEYLKYFYQTVQPYMFFVDASDWLKVLTETSLRNDTRIWENNKSEMYIKCIVPRTDSEMKLIAKLAKHSHFQFARSSHFHLESCSCCSFPLPLPISTKPYEEVFESNGITAAKDIELEDEHLDRGCFMGVISSNEDDLITTEFLESKYINSCDNYSIDTKDDNILNEVKREVCSPTNIENNFNNNYTHDYLMNSQDLELQNHFEDVDISNVKLEGDIFNPLDETDEGKTKSLAENPIEDNVLVKTEVPEHQNENNVKLQYTELQTVNAAAAIVEEPNYEPNSTEEIVGLKYEPNLSQPTESQALNEENPGTVTYIADKDRQGDYICEWKDCKKVFNSHQELLEHIPTHTVGKDHSNDVLGKSSSAKEDAPKPQKRKRAAGDVVVADSKNKRRNPRPTSDDTDTEEVLHCTTIGCNRSFSTKCKLKSHQRRCCAINDFSCRWPGCTIVFQSSLDLHNHVKIEHRKCTDNVQVHSGPGQIEKNLVLNCSSNSCGHAFTCPDRLAAHEKDCSLRRTQNQLNGIFNANPNFRPSATPTATVQDPGPSSQVPKPSIQIPGPSSQVPGPSSQVPEPSHKTPPRKAKTSKRKCKAPKGFARVSKYSD